MAAELVRELAVEPIELVVHSGAKRTRGIALAVAKRLGCEVREDTRWLERDFNTWEGQSWDAIWRETGDLMNRMITDPHDFRPGGGETGAELQARVWEAWDNLPRDRHILIVAHGGSIAAILSVLSSAELGSMIDFVPGYAQVVRLIT